MIFQLIFSFKKIINTSCEKYVKNAEKSSPGAEKICQKKAEKSPPGGLFMGLNTQVKYLLKALIFEICKKNPQNIIYS